MEASRSSLEPFFEDVGRASGALVAGRDYRLEVDEGRNASRQERSELRHRVLCMAPGQRAEQASRFLASPTRRSRLYDDDVYTGFEVIVETDLSSIEDQRFDTVLVIHDEHDQLKLGIDPWQEQAKALGNTSALRLIAPLLPETRPSAILGSHDATRQLDGIFDAVVDTSIIRSPLWWGQ